MPFLSHKKGELFQMETVLWIQLWTRNRAGIIVTKLFNCELKLRKFIEFNMGYRSTSTKIQKLHILLNWRFYWVDKLEHVIQT